MMTGVLDWLENCEDCTLIFDNDCILSIFILNRDFLRAENFNFKYFKYSKYYFSERDAEKWRSSITLQKLHFYSRGDSSYAKIEWY